MAYNNRLLTKTYLTSADLSAGKYKILQMNTSSRVVLAGAGATIIPFGICTQNGVDGSTTAAEVPVCKEGITEVKCGGTVVEGAHVASDASGLLVAAASGDYIVGIAEEDGVVGDVVPVTLTLGIQLN